MKNNIQLRQGMRGRRAGAARGFSLIEVLFAIAMIGVGVVGILSLFTTGINAANQSGSTTTAAMEAQSLYTRIVSEMDSTQTKRVYLSAIYDPASPTPAIGNIQDPPKYALGDPPYSWIQGAPFTSNAPTPVLCDPDPADATGTNPATARNDMWWVCKVSKTPMNKSDPILVNPDAQVPPPVAPATTPPTNIFPRGLYQIAIAVYRNYKGGPLPSKPAAVFTTFVTAGY